MTRVLVVEDSATQAEQLRIVLESAQFEVDVARTGEAGLERLRANGIDLVLSDIVMPGMSGFELCRAAKAEPATKQIPFVLCTALGDPLEVIRALECGADGFVEKPYEPAALIERVRAILENRRLRAARRGDGVLDIHFHGETFAVASGREQILDLLVGSFEDAVRKHAALADSKAHLEDANRELEAFSYSVAHDLGAPIRAIEGFTRALVDDCGDKLDAASRAHVDKVLVASARMRGIIDDLLKLSRVVKAEVSPRDVDISATARLVASNLIAAEPNRTVDFTVEPGLRGHADSGLLRVLFENLLGNAWKFTGKRVDAKVEVGAIDQPSGIAFFVRDNGAGFSRERAHKLFLPFERLHDASEFPGTGVGLTTSRRIVERHGGKIWAEGSEGHGATFYFTLPAGRRELRHR
jgi:signal transduction histidine kinase